MSGFSPKVAAQIIERDKGCCFWCGIYVLNGTRGFDYSIHHRVPRGSGGTKSPWVNESPNGLLLCGSGVQKCHGHFEGNRAVALELGVIVSALGAFARVENRPENVPVTDRDGHEWTLTADGRKVPARK